MAETIEVLLERLRSAQNITTIALDRDARQYLDLDDGLARPRRQTLRGADIDPVGDIFAGTVVIRERTDEAPTFDETFSNPIADAALRRVQKRTEFTANVMILSDPEIDVIETFLRRRWDLTDRQRIWMAWRIALPLMYKLKPDYDLATFSYEGFLEEILHRYHARQRFLN